MEKILQDMQLVTDEMQRVLHFGDFTQFTHGLGNELGPRFRTIVEKSEAYEEAKNRITAHLNQDFKELVESVEGYKECRPIHDFERTFDFDQWKMVNSTLDPIKDKLKELKAWEKLLEGKIRKQEVRGFIQVQGKKL